MNKTTMNAAVAAKCDELIQEMEAMEKGRKGKVSTVPE